MSVPNGSDQDASASTQFKRSGGWSADEVARLHHNDPRLLEDPHLACWWRTIVHTAGKCARSFINRAFPENTLYRFCKLPQWPTALPWIAGPRDRGSNKEPGPGGYSSEAACAVQAPQVSGSCRYSPLAHDYVSPPTTCRTRPHTPAETRHPAPNSPASLESAVEPSPTPARAPAQQPSSPLSQPATTHPVFAVSLYLHVSLLFGIAKLGLTTTAGGPREKGHHAKVYFPVTHMAAFRVHLRCPTLDEAGPGPTPKYRPCPARRTGAARRRVAGRRSGTACCRRSARRRWDGGRGGRAGRGAVGLCDSEWGLAGPGRLADRARRQLQRTVSPTRAHGTLVHAHAHSLRPACPRRRLRSAAGEAGPVRARAAANCSARVGRPLAGGSQPGCCPRSRSAGTAPDVVLC